MDHFREYRFSCHQFSSHTVHKTVNILCILLLTLFIIKSILCRLFNRVLFQKHSFYSVKGQSHRTRFNKIHLNCELLDIKVNLAGKCIQLGYQLEYFGMSVLDCSSISVQFIMFGNITMHKT